MFHILYEMSMDQINPSNQLIDHIIIVKIVFCPSGKKLEVQI